MLVAVIADVHGNLPALSAVLDDIARQGISRVINLGDSVSGPLWPRETFERLQHPGIESVRGNHDRLVADGYPGSWELLALVCLDSDQRGWLGRLPVTLEPIAGILACHARPDDDSAYLLEDVDAGRLVAASGHAVAARLGRTGEARLILCGHSHRASCITLPDGRVVLNPGSVGCPAYADPRQPAHVSETGAPEARYAVIDYRDRQVADAHLLAVGYDVELSARRAEALGHPEWGTALRTGRMA